ncbi:hypothetical protein DL98DRAFT_580022 [Cadophora sp. DSE1049]|nr:hypothetical protein DL98DRAFT_580022 [Cadophora sp. DSE1049]
MPLLKSPFQRLLNHLASISNSFGAPSPSSNPPAPSFPDFSLLPPEIRIQIWLQTSVPALIHPTRTSTSATHDSYTTRFTRSPHPVPPTLHTCREARFSLLHQPRLTSSAGEKYGIYTLCRMGLTSRNFLFVCLESDILMLSVEDMVISPIPVSMRDREILLPIPTALSD